TKPSLRRNGLARILMHEVVQAVCDGRRGSVFFGFPRVRRIADVATELSPAFVAAGHDGGRNVVDGRREVHLILYAVPSYAEFVHVAPPTELFESSFLRENLYAFLRLAIKAGDYPSEFFVGPPSIHEFRELGFIFEYDVNSPSRALEITGYTGESKNHDQICDTLDELVESRRGVQHETVTVLADKIELIRKLINRGFAVGGYLPAWYSRDHSRF